MGNTVGKNTRKLSFYLIHEQFDRESFHKQRNQEHVNLTRQRLTRQLSTS